jgi:hypothetical protein
MNALENVITMASQTPAAWGIKQLQSAGRNAFDSFTKWATPPPLSPVPENNASSLLQPGGVKQAVNNVVAYGTLNPQLVRPFQQQMPPLQVHANGPPPVQNAVQPTQGPVSALSNVYNDFFNKLKQQINLTNSRLQGPTPSPTPPLPTPTLSPGVPTRDELIKAIQLGSAGDPVATMAAQMIDQSQQYPIFQQHPFIPVMHSQLESRGFKDFSEKPDLVYKPKQGFGWGATIPDEKYNPSTIEQVLHDLITAVGGGRTIESGYTPEQIRTSQAYENFRQTGQIDPYLLKFAGPVSAQNPQAGENYIKHAKFVLNKYNEILDQLMKKRGGSYPLRY